MGFGGGGSSGMTAHVHNNVPLQGGPLDFANDTIASLNAGSTTFSDGAALQELVIGNAGETLTVNGGATAPEWVAGAAAGSYQFVGTTDTLVITPNGFNGLHLAFTAIDMTAVTELIAVVSAERSVNSTGFLWNGQTANYGFGGQVTTYAGTGTDFGEPGNAALFEIGHWASGTYQNFTVHFVLNENDNKTYCFGTGGGSDGGVYAGGGNANVDTEIDSISFVEAGRHMVAGDHRLTVYKVVR